MQSHEAANAWESMRSSMLAYRGNSIPRESHRMLSQVSVKAMRLIPIRILLVFTAALCRTTNATRSTAGPEVEFRNAIPCVWYLTACALLFRYGSHADSTIVYMQEYLQRFYETKNLFLTYCPGRIWKPKADIVSNDLMAKTTARRLEQELN